MKTIKAGYSINGSLEKYNQLLSEDGYEELLNQQADDNFDDEDLFCKWVKEEAFVKNIFNNPQDSYDNYCQWVYDKVTEIFLAENDVQYYSDDNPFNTAEEDEKLEQAEISDDFYDFNITAVSYYEM